MEIPLLQLVGARGCLWQDRKWGAETKVLVLKLPFPVGQGMAKINLQGTIGIASPFICRTCLEMCAEGDNGKQP